MKLPHPNKEDGFYMEKDLYNNIMEAPRRLSKKDILFLVCGDPGNGKSTMASQILYTLDNSIVKRECFVDTMDKYKNGILKDYEKNRSQGKAKAHDEVREAASQRVMEKKVKFFYDFIYENRQCHAIQCLIQSDFWKFPRDIVFNRALFMVWVLEDDRWNNGKFIFYSRKAMKALYDRGKKKHIRTPTGYSFRGTFPDFWAGSPNYLERKKKNLIEKHNYADKAKKITIRGAQYLAMNRNDNFSCSQFAEIFKCNLSRVHKNKNDWLVS